MVDRFLEDLADRGTPIARPAEPLTDSGFIAALSEVHRLPDLVYPTVEERRAKRRSGR